jgi:hypothetical protein
MAGEEEHKGFKVQDKRRFSPDTGEPREAEKPSEEGAAAIRKESSKLAEEPQIPLPEINFSTLVISLSTQALMHLGEIPNPLDGTTEKDTAGAKQTIDIISILRDKTRGNLDEGEEKLLEDVLYDLRMRYVEVVKKG